MDTQTFNKEKRQLNKAYFEVFGEVPCMQNYICSREEYLAAIKQAVQTNTKLEEILPCSGAPMNKDALI